MKKLSTALLLAVLACSLGFAASAEAKKAGRPTFESRWAACDKDHDNYLSASEFSACFPRRAKAFSAIDKGGAGKVSMEDAKAYFKAQRAAKKSK